MKTRTSRIARFAIPCILGLGLLTLPGCIFPFHPHPRIVIHGHKTHNKHNKHHGHHGNVQRGHRRVHPGHAKGVRPRPR